MAEFYTIVTDAGREAVAKATQAGEKVNITHMAVGDGGGSAVTPNEEQKQLVGECWRGLVANYKQEGTSLIIDTYIPSDEESFTVREMGIFTSDGVLFAVCNTPEMRKVLPSEGAVGNFTLGMELDVTNIDMSYIEIHTNPELDFIPTSEKGQPDGVAELGEDKKLKAEQVPTNITSHIANKQNPHGVTTKQIGAMPSCIRTVFGEDSAILDNIKEEGLYFFIDSNNDFGAGIAAGFELFVTRTVYSNSDEHGICQRLTAVYRNQISDPISFWRTYYHACGWSVWKQIATREKQQVFELPLTEIASKSDGYAVYSKSQDGVVLLNVGLTNLSNIISQMTVANLPVGFRPPNIIGGALNASFGKKGGYNIFPDGRVNMGMFEELTGDAEFSVAFVAAGG